MITVSEESTALTAANSSQVVIMSTKLPRTGAHARVSVAVAGSVFVRHDEQEKHVDRNGWLARMVANAVNDAIEPAGLSPAQRRVANELIGEERARTVRLIDSLTRQWDGIVEASSLTTNDDEHDPEGATIAFERAQVQAMLRRTRVDLEDLDQAARRVVTGEYQVCERCGGPIASGRLTARPAARTCITCANGVAGRSASGDGPK